MHFQWANCKFVEQRKISIPTTRRIFNLTKFMSIYSWENIHFFIFFFLSSSSSSLTHYRISSLGIFSTMNGICFTKRTFACGCMDAWMLGCAQLMLPVLPHNSNSNNDSKMQHILYNSDHIIIIFRYMYIKKYSLLSHSLFSFVPIIIILMLL